MKKENSQVAIGRGIGAFMLKGLNFWVEKAKPMLKTVPKTLYTKYLLCKYVPCFLNFRIIQ